MNIDEEIEESLRICDELFARHPEISSEPLPEPEKPVVPLEFEKVTPPPVREAPKVEPKEEIKLEFEKVTPPVKETPKVEPIEKPKVEPKEEIKLEFEKVTPLPVRAIPKEEPKEEPEDETRSVGGTLVRLAVCVVIAVLAAVLITKFVASHTTVDGNSMVPCLHSGDELIVEKISYLFGEPKRFDVVVFEQSEGVNYIKRVIGLPGERVQIVDSKIFINGKAIFDEYRKEKMKEPGIADEEIQLGSDEYFVLGDNRNASKDSRDQEVGMVTSDQIWGRAWFRVLPFDTFGIVG